MESLVSGPQVLVVEDERVVAKDLQLTLTRLGYSVPVTVPSGAAALEAASQRSPDLVIMDVRIQGDVDGVRTAELLRERVDAPLIFLTAYADQATVARAKQLEPQAYLLKPVRTEELRSAVEIALHKHRVLRDQRAREQRLQARLELAERMAALGTVAAGVAHEVNNPLSFVLANLEFALGELHTQTLDNGSPAWMRELVQALGEAQTGAERVRQIVSDLRAFGRPSSARAERQNINRVLRSAIDTVAHELRKRARVSTQYGELPPVLANETRLSQVFMNLLQNAAHAVAAPGAAGQEIHIRSYVAADGRVAVEVEDQGCGMSPEIQARIFDPFFTTKDPGEGTGLGLAICRGIIGSLHGEIEVQSREGVGSRFTVSLPRAPDAPPEAATVSSLPPAPAPAVALRGSILIVDDEPLLRSVIARMIGSEHELTLVEGADQALALIEAGDRYDAILCDLMLRRASGMELHAALLARHADQARRMIFLSGGAMTVQSAEFLKLMPRRHLLKPFTGDELREVLQQHLARFGPTARPRGAPAFQAGQLQS